MEKMILALSAVGFLYFFGAKNLLDSFKGIFLLVAAFCCFVLGGGYEQSSEISLIALLAGLGTFLAAAIFIFSSSTESLRMEDSNDFDD